MEVRWFRDSFDIAVNLYEDRRDRTDVQDSDYRGRTALSILGLQEGILSLYLRNLRPSDSGVYSCYATDRVWDGQGKTELIVRVQRDSQGLFSVSSYIKVKQQSNMFSCLVRSKTPKPDWESKLHISSDFFPGVSGWMVAFFLTLALSIGAIPLLVIQWRRMDGMNFIIIMRHFI
ncbi:UNVERIFIED_CONTAM: hypothetical protein FKN15_053955 [Acipenser sinensis]